MVAGVAYCIVPGQAIALLLLAIGPSAMGLALLCVGSVVAYGVKFVVAKGCAWSDSLDALPFLSFSLIPLLLLTPVSGMPVRVLLPNGIKNITCDV